MFFGIGDVDVKLNQKSKLIQDYWEVNTPMATKEWYSHEWVLTVSSLDVNIVVTAKANPKAPKEILVSCLLAGLKKVSDHHIYDAAVARMETQLGFAVDRWISPEIAKVDTVENDSDGVYYEVSIIPVIFDILIGEPQLTAHLHSSKQEVEVEMILNDGLHSFKSSIMFSQDLWCFNQSECMNVSKFKLIEGLYQQKPELSHLWTQIRYNWFDMKDISPETISWYSNIQGSSSELKMMEYVYKYNPAAMVQIMPAAKPSAEDPRVNQLPGLDERVKNPVTKQQGLLRHVVIELNDRHKWTRERIADWLDTLDIDISFKIKESNE